VAESLARYRKKASDPLMPNFLANFPPYSYVVESKILTWSCFVFLQEEVKRLSDVKNLVNQLYEALNVEEHQLKKERELFGQLEELKHELEPMEEVSKVIEHTSTHALTLSLYRQLKYSQMVENKKHR